MSKYLREITARYFNRQEKLIKISDFNDEFNTIDWFYYIILNNLSRTSMIRTDGIRKLNLILIDNKKLFGDFKITSQYNLEGVFNYELETNIIDIHNSNHLINSIELKINFLNKVIREISGEKWKNYKNFNLINNIMKKMNYIRRDYYSKNFKSNDESYYLIYEIPPASPDIRIKLLMKKNNDNYLYPFYQLNKKEQTNFFLRHRYQKITNVSGDKIEVKIYDKEHVIEKVNLQKFTKPDNYLIKDIYKKLQNS